MSAKRKRLTESAVSDRLSSRVALGYIAGYPRDLQEKCIAFAKEQSAYWGMEAHMEQWKAELSKRWADLRAEIDNQPTP